MRICHLSWEFPPVIYGGLGRHVEALTAAQVAAGHEVMVITQAPEGSGPSISTERNGVRVVRIPRDVPHVTFDAEHLLAWVMGMEHALTRAAIEALHNWPPDVIHAHDWLVAHTALAVRRLSAAPLVVTMHATEAGRMRGWVHSETSRAVHSIEWWLANEAQRIIACSDHMRWEIDTLFGIEGRGLPVDVIPNGIDLRKWRTTKAAAETARERYAPDGPLLVFTGRIEWEKGVHTLLDAMPRLRRLVPGVRLVISGRGGQMDSLRARARALRLGSSVTFEGWLPQKDLHALIAAADCAVIPSLYEPFGLVALEALALGTPIAVARTGGLAEIVGDDLLGWTFTPGDPESLAGVVAEALGNPGEATRRTRSARARLRHDYSWARVADRTTEVYERATRSTHNDARPPMPEIPRTNLLYPHLT